MTVLQQQENAVAITSRLFTSDYSKPSTGKTSLLLIPLSSAIFTDIDHGSQITPFSKNIKGRRREKKRVLRR